MREVISLGMSLAAVFVGVASLHAAATAQTGSEPSPQQGRSGGSETRPNFVFILADDLGWGDVGYHQSPIPTPHLDRLAAEGVRLERHYVSPVCSPTRAGLMTGRYWSRFGITMPGSRECLPDGTPTVASVLRKAGYRTAITGKWHLGGASLPSKWPGAFGFDHFYGCLDGHAHPFTHVYTSGGGRGDDGVGVQTWNRNGQFIEEEGHVTDLITREATSWIEGNRGQPFFLYVPYTAPHVKCLDTPEWVAKCAHVPAAWRNYAAMVAHLDDGVGRIAATLDRLGLRENTLIVFSSDNGGHVTTQPFRGAKGSVWEGGVRGVAWANWPAELGVGVSSEPVCIVDWMPTFCGLAKVEAPARMDGRDLWPMLSQAKVSGELRSLYLLGTDGETAALVEGDWKLIRKPEGTELYHLPSDSREKNDRSAFEQERTQRMQETMRRVSANDRDSLDPHTKGPVGPRKAF